MHGALEEWLLQPPHQAADAIVDNFLLAHPDELAAAALRCVPAMVRFCTIHHILFVLQQKLPQRRLLLCLLWLAGYEDFSACLQLPLPLLSFTQLPDFPGGEAAESTASTAGGFPLILICLVAAPPPWNVSRPLLPGPASSPPFRLRPIKAAPWVCHADILDAR